MDTELVQLRCGLRKLARIDIIPIEDSNRISKQYESEGYIAYISPARYDHDEKTNQFSYCDAGKYVTVLVARDEEALFEGISCLYSEIFPNKSSLGMGSLLGYPDCCIKEHKSKILVNDVARAVNALNNTKGVLNPLLNHLPGGTKFISHFPCSYDCENSIRLAEATKSESGIVSDDMNDKLKTVGILFSDSSYILIEGNASDNQILYDKFLYYSSIPGFSELLNDAKIITLNGNTLRIFNSDKEVTAYSRNCDIFIFNWGGKNIYQPGHFDDYLNAMHLSEPQSDTNPQNLTRELSALIGIAACNLNNELTLLGINDYGKETELLLQYKGVKSRLNVKRRTKEQKDTGYTSKHYQFRKYSEDINNASGGNENARDLDTIISALISADK